MRKLPYAALIVFLVAIACSPAWAIPSEVVVTHRLCKFPVAIAKERRPSFPPPSPAEVPSLPIGCEIVDAAIGCPPGAPLRLRARYDGPMGTEGRVAFRNLSSQAFQRLVLRGAARRDGSTILLGQGISEIGGFESDPKPVPLLVSTVVTSKGFLRSMQRIRMTSWSATATFDLNQFVGSVLVRRFRVINAYVPCLLPGPPQDEIVLAGNSSGRKAIALIDGNRATGCMTNEKRFGMTGTGVGNLISSTACPGPSRVTVFGLDSGVHFVPNVLPDWTNDPAEKLDITLGPMAAQPVKLWVLYDLCFDPEFDPPANCANRCAFAPYSSAPPCDPIACANSTSGSCDPALLRQVMPKKVLEDAGILYREQFGGIAFADSIEDLSVATASDPPELRGKINAALEMDGCGEDSPLMIAKLNEIADLADLMEPTAPPRLNIFFLRSGLGYGAWCGSADGGRDMITMNAAQRDLTLAHEIGHAFLNSGEQESNHLDAADSRYNDNLMIGSDFGRHLTLGQLFRASLDASSALNRHGARPGGAVVDCAEFVDTDFCPAVSCDHDRETDATLVGSELCVP